MSECPVINLIFKDKEVEIFKFPNPPSPYYIEVKPGMIYETSKMETLLIDFEKQSSKYKAMGF